MGWEKPDRAGRNGRKWVARNKNSVSIRKRRGGEGKKGVEKEVGGKGKEGKGKSGKLSNKKKKVSLSCILLMMREVGSLHLVGRQSLREES